MKCSYKDVHPIATGLNNICPVESEAVTWKEKAAEGESYGWFSG